MYNELEQFILFLICVYLGCFLTFAIWFVKLGIEKYILKMTLIKAKAIEAKMDKFDNDMNDIKSKVNEMDRDNLTLQDVQLLYYLHESAPVIKKYKDELEKEVVKITEQMENQSSRIENTSKTLNIFLNIISFGKLQIVDKEEYFYG